MKPLTTVLTLGATLRLTRLIVTDDLGQWWVKDPIDQAAARWWEHRVELHHPYEPEQPWWWKYRSGLDCPWCVGFWVAAGVLGSAALAGEKRTWRYVTGALTLNYVAATLASAVESDGSLAPRAPEESHDDTH